MAPPVKNPSIFPLIVVFLIYAALVGAWAAQFDYDFSGFICLGSRYAAPELTGSEILRIPGRGYDGQFFYFAARDPFIRGEAWTRMDVAAYRYNRIFYPLLAAVLSLPDAAFLPYALIVINLGAVLLGTFFVIRMLIDTGLSAWYGCIYACFSGFILAVFRDLPAPLAAGLTVGGIYFFEKRRYWPGAVLFAAAVLTRELMAVVPLIYFLFAVTVHKDRRRALAALFSLLPFLIWFGYVFFRIGDSPIRGGEGNLAAPLAGPLAYAYNLSALPGRIWEKIYFWIFSAVTVLSLVLAGRELTKRRDEVAVLFFLYAVLPIFMSGSVWVEPWSFGRVLVPAAVFLMLAFIRTRERIYLLPLAGHLGLTAATIFWTGLL